MHIAISINVDWFFLSHRLALAQHILARGWACTVIAADTGRGREIEAHGIQFYPLPLSRSGTNPLKEWRLVPLTRQAYADVRPDLVHQMTIKPILYGSLGAKKLGIPVLNHITGLGHMFTSKHDLSLSLNVVRLWYRHVLGYPRSLTMFENPDDRGLFVQQKLVKPEQTRIVKGCGVDVGLFAQQPLPQGAPVFMLPARLLVEKGVVEFVEAARRLRAQGVTARFVLVGDPDEGNPTALDAARVRAWVAEGVVEWWGRSAAMHQTLAQATVVVLPSYREGLPKVLLEAAAVGRPIIATDVPGCREVVQHEANGLLVAPKSPEALAEAMRSAIARPADLRAWADASRRIAEQQFANERINAQTEALYTELLNR